MIETEQQIIARELGVKPEIDAEIEIAKRVAFLADYLGKTGVDGFVLGISGGQDSLLAGMLAQRAVEQRRAQGGDVAFHAVLLPYGEQADRKDALLAIETIKPDVVHDLDIRKGVDGFATSFADATAEQLADYHKGNVKARMRMIAQYAFAGTHNLVVIGTDHAAEAVTGFFTKYGDGGADILPLSGLSKRQGRQMLRSLDVPEVFVTKAPTADLLDETPAQADETELGISYDTLDDYLEGRPVDPDVARMIEDRYLATAHKRAQPVAFTD